MTFDEISLYYTMAMMLVRGFCWQVVRLRRPRLMFLGKGAKIYGSDKFTFQSPLKIGNYCCLDARFSDGIRVGRNFMIGDFCTIRASGSRTFHSPGIHAGEFVSFGPYSCIGGGFGLKLGNSIIGGPYCSIHPENHTFEDLNVPIRSQGISGRGITIESDVWIGAKATILDGSSVGPGSIIAAGAVLRSEFPARAIIGGIPARTLSIRGEQ